MSSNAASSPVYYVRYSGPQLMFLRVPVAFIRTTRVAHILLQASRNYLSRTFPFILGTLNVLTWFYKLISHTARSDSDTLVATTRFTLSVSEATIIPYHNTITCGWKNG